MSLLNRKNLKVNGTAVPSEGEINIDLDGAIAGIKEKVTVASGASVPYVLTWDSTKIAKFGPFGDFTVWMDNGVGGFKLATLDPTMYTNGAETQATYYEFDLSGIKSLIIIK